MLDHQLLHTLDSAKSLQPIVNASQPRSGGAFFLPMIWMAVAPAAGKKHLFVTAVTKNWVSNVSRVTDRIPNLVNTWRQETG